MTSYGKPRDKVSAYAKAGTMSNWTSSKPSKNAGGNSNEDVRLKKKHYRARGCRGGASRKGRKKHPNRQQHDDREAQENLDPSPNTDLPTSGFVPNEVEETEPKKILVQSQNVSSKHSCQGIVEGDRRHKKVTFAPTPSHHNSCEKHSYNHSIIDSSKEGTKRHKFMHTFGGRGHKSTTVQAQAQAQERIPLSILPKESDGNIELLIDESANHKRAISPANRSNAKDSPARSPGFSFFSISPRSYLTGRKSKAQKLN